MIKESVKLLASAARTVTTNSNDITNQVRASGIKVVVDITNVPGSAPSLVVKIQMKDILSGKYVDLLTSAALTAQGTTTLTIYPGLTAAANVVVSDVLPPVFRVNVTAGNGNSATYSVGGNLLF